MCLASFTDHYTPRAYRRGHVFGMHHMTTLHSTSLRRGHVLDTNAGGVHIAVRTCNLTAYSDQAERLTQLELWCDASPEEKPCGARCHSTSIVEGAAANEAACSDAERLSEGDHSAEERRESAGLHA